MMNIPNVKDIKINKLTDIQLEELDKRINYAVSVAIDKSQKFAKVMNLRGTMVALARVEYSDANYWVSKVFAETLQDNRVNGNMILNHYTKRLEDLGYKIRIQDSSTYNLLELIISWG